MTSQISIIIIDLPKILRAIVLDGTKIVFPMGIVSGIKASLRKISDLPKQVGQRSFGQALNTLSQHHLSTYEGRPKNVVKISNSSYLCNFSFFVFQDSHHRSPSLSGCNPFTKNSSLKLRLALLGANRLIRYRREITTFPSTTSKISSDSSKFRDLTIDLGILRRKLSHRLPALTFCKRHVCLMINIKDDHSERFKKYACISLYQNDSEPQISRRNNYWRRILQHRSDLQISPLTLSTSYPAGTRRFKRCKDAFSVQKENQATDNRRISGQLTK